MEVFIKSFIHDMKRRQMPFFAHNVVRSKKEQDQLYVTNVSQAKGGFSPHNYGMAADLIHSLLVWNGMDENTWSIVGHIGKEVSKRIGIDVVWGGDWQGWMGNPLGDPAHWELKDWKQQKRDFPEWTDFWRSQEK